MIITTLKAMPYAQATVKRFPNHVVLTSYTTDVAEIVGGVLKVYGLYSQTTRKHISAFVKEYCRINYEVAKHCYTNNLGYDLITKKYIALGE